MSGDESKTIKVTDKRMFTPEGELRDEYRFLEAEKAGKASQEKENEKKQRPEAAPGAPEQQPPPRSADSAPEAGGASDEASPRLEIPGTPTGMGAPTFLDLVALLAEPVSIYLGDLELPDGKSAENLEMARLHIDLLDVLRQKTAGNLSAQETAVLEDLLYRLRVRYIQKRG